MADNKNFSFDQTEGKLHDLMLTSEDSLCVLLGNFCDVRADINMGAMHPAWACTNHGENSTKH